MAEAELITRMVAGDEEARNAVLARLWPFILHVVVETIGPRRADDYTGFAAIVAAERLKSYDPARGGLRTWLGWILKRELAREKSLSGGVIRRPRSRSEGRVADRDRAGAVCSLDDKRADRKGTIADGVVSGEVPVLEQVAENERARMVWAVIADIPDPVNRAIVIATMEEKPMSRVAWEFGTCQSTISVRKPGALAVFRGKMERKMPEELCA